MKNNVASILLGMGYVLDKDFFCYRVAPDDVQVKWLSSGPQPTESEIDAAELPATKAARTADNRAECSRRIFARYPAGRQLSALAGLYDSANVATMTDWIAANISAENTAADAIEAATTVAAVEAVTVAWPV